MCPRLGDAFALQTHVDGIKADLAQHRIRKAAEKQLDTLDEFARLFIARSPFMVMATADADGNCDASPRGDAPGFVVVLDDRRLLIPDRPGNNRVDSLQNLAANPNEFSIEQELQLITQTKEGGETDPTSVQAEELVRV